MRGAERTVTAENRSKTQRTLTTPEPKRRRCRFFIALLVGSFVCARYSAPKRQTLSASRVEPCDIRTPDFIRGVLFFSNVKPPSSHYRKCVAKQAFDPLPKATHYRVSSANGILEGLQGDTSPCAFTLWNFKKPFLFSRKEKQCFGLLSKTVFCIAKKIVNNKTGDR